MTFEKYEKQRDEIKKKFCKKCDNDDCFDCTAYLKLIELFNKIDKLV